MRDCVFAQITNPMLTHSTLNRYLLEGSMSFSYPVVCASLNHHYIISHYPFNLPFFSLSLDGARMCIAVTSYHLLRPWLSHRYRQACPVEASLIASCLTFPHPLRTLTNHYRLSRYCCQLSERMARGGAPSRSGLRAVC